MRRPASSDPARGSRNRAPGAEACLGEVPEGGVCGQTALLRRAPFLRTPFARSAPAAGVLLAALAFAARAAPPRAEARYEREIDDAIARTSGIYPVPKPLVLAVIRAESDFDSRAVSRAGAIGLMQLMPGTARRVGIAPEDLRDPGQNVLAGVRLLAVLLRRYRGDVVSALVAYNARPRRRFAPIPRNGETPAYVRAVLQNLQRYRGAGAEPDKWTR